MATTTRHLPPDFHTFLRPCRVVTCGILLLACRTTEWQPHEKEALDSRVA